MAIQTKMAEGITCRLCGRPIEGKIPVESLSTLESGKLLAAALADKCQHCEVFLCKECHTNERRKLRGLTKLRGFDCPGCGSKFSGSNLSVYPTDLDLDAVVAGPSDHKRTQVTVQTEIASGIICKHCSQPIEGKILVEPLSGQEAKRAFPTAGGFRCQYCRTFLCKECYTNARGELSGLKKVVGVDCPGCGLQFYSPFGSNLGIYPADVDLDSIVSEKAFEKSKAFSKLLDDLGKVHDFYREGFLEDVLARIKEQEELVIKHIEERIQYGDEKTGVFKQNPESLVTKLIVIGRAGATWLLQREYLPDDYVNKIIAVTQGKKPPLMYSFRWYATLALIEIEIARKDGHLTPAIIQSYQSDGQDMEEHISLAIQLGRITWDERIVDCLVETLDEEFRINDPEFTASSLGDLFLDKHIAGPAQRAAESLIAIGNERGIAAIIPHLLKHINQWHIHGREKVVMDWCVRFGSMLATHLVQSLNHEDSRVRLFVTKTLAKIGDPSFIGTLSALENDPDRQVRDEARQAVKKLQG